MKKNNKKKVIAGAALATAAAAGAAYWLYGSKDAAKHRKMIGDWSKKAQKEVMAAAKKIKNLDKSSYAELVSKSIQRYSKAKGITSKELSGLKRELKTAWNNLEKSASPKKKSAEAKKAKRAR